MTLRLPTVTLFVLDGADCGTALLRRAIEDTLAVVEPLQTVVFTFDPSRWRGFNTVRVPNCPSSAHAMWQMWYTVPEHIRHGTHTIHVEWDGWVHDSDQWTDEFLDYDYIGAPWPVAWCSRPEWTVGNGLGLRSLRLMRLLCDNPLLFRFHHPEDAGICHNLREALEAEGVRFAPLELARRFSWEHGPYPGLTFMHHGCWNWLKLLSAEALRERMELADDCVKRSEAWRLLTLHPMRERVVGVDRG